MKITLEEGQKLFFTSDTHINHKNICRGTTSWTGDLLRTRNFDSLDDMNFTLINNINSKVGKDDILIHLGDFSFGGHQHIPVFRDQIFCNNVIFILGNHDEHIQKNTSNYQALFSSVHHYLELEVVRKVHQIFGVQPVRHFVLSHFPIASWNKMGKGWMHLHGHVHFTNDKKVGPGKMLDVGVDGNDYMPYSLKEVVDILEKRPVKSLFTFDHHEMQAT